MSGTIFERVQRLLPGLVLLAVLAGLATLVASVVPGVNALLLGVVFGAVVANTTGVPAWARPGVRTQTVLLEAGIVLLGARIAVDELVASGVTLVVLVVATVVASIFLVELVAGRVFGLARDTSSLLAAGASICGVSAATAIAGTIDADGESLAHVVATVLLFDAITLAVFPIAGDVLPLTGRQFGVWAGLSMFSTGPVTAAGFAHSDVAGQWATVTKLARNSMLGVVALWYAFRYADGSSTDVRAVLDGVPGFLVGFVVLAALTNVGVFSGDVLAAFDTGSDVLFALAFVGLGLDVRLAAMRETGMTPVFVLAVQLLAVSAVTLAAVIILI
ncbi:putative sulfate exporter family transporter [Haloferax sp. MBLA0076]|uniref:Putative sulfate exporter family transporter n=1 Tax=Haloferax litoreum TaxID=2666140 RepID=A0A6A8GIZ7_9EURY|nr:MULTISPECIES: putative sulfate exporter family transporter [Haloferax]KAB1193589.1 putative sulfate exporter family transporter [Haloferax sp. CBA1148]MRX22107.1 putative sulfate exporter family transporter [Haloferax litoreum]